MCNIKNIFSSLGKLGLYCNFCGNDEERSLLKRRLHSNRLACDLRSSMEQSIHWPLYRQLHMHSECTKAACVHWSWRGQEEYLDWKSRAKSLGDKNQC